MITESPPSPLAFIVIQNDPVISLDLVGMLETSFPNSVTHLFGQLDAASEVLDAALETACILIASNLVTMITSSKIEDLVARGARVVVIGASEATGFASVVSIPFTTKMILDVLV